MKKYRLKEEVKKYFNACLYRLILTFPEWIEHNVDLEALEEVPQRVELEYHFENTNGLFDGIRRKDGLAFGGNMLEICEKAYNGELLDIDSLDINDFTDFYMYSNIPVDDLVNVLKQYLKEKANEQ